MDNLEEIYCSLVSVNEIGEDKQLGSSYTDSVACIITSKSLVVYEEGLNDLPKVHEIKGVVGSLKYVKYLSIYDIIFLATENELIKFNHHTLETQVCSVTKNPIIAISLNPAETIIVVIESDYSFFSYTLSEITLDIKYTSNLTDIVPVSDCVGWGSQNTQFRGPKQKDSKEAEEKCEVEQLLLDGPPRISWRGNGELFAINYCFVGKRYLKVFDSDLNPLNQSEEYMNLCEPVAFMGQGQRIACCSIKNDVNELVIFEKNCKVKEVYDLHEVKGKIQNLVYHPQMNILAIWSMDNEGGSYINILLFSNAQWYLKQQLVYPPSNQVLGFDWLNLQENLFTTCELVVSTSKNIEHRYFRFTINRGRQPAKVAVINGRTVEFYNFDKGTIPPPMHSYSFEHTRPINRISFHPMKEICVIVDSLCQTWLLDISKEDMVTINITEIPKLTGTENDLATEWEEQTSDDLDTTLQETYEEGVANFVLQYDDTDTIVPKKVLDKDSNVIYMTKRLLQIENLEIEFDFALTSDREFYVDGMMVCGDVTSIFIFREYLLMTHANSKLYTHRLKDYHVFSNTMDLSKLFSREVEQGARLVICTNVLPPQIILLLPRGNLECIGCKLMTIDVIENMLKENKWKDVLQIIREEKVNWNVLIDLNPVRFSEHIEDFVKAAGNLSFLSSIVTEFNLADNCFQTFYKNYLPNSIATRNSNKLTIVESILKYLLSMDCVHNLSTIVAIQLKHISLKSALKSIKDVFDFDQDENEAVCSKALNKVLIQEHFRDVLDVTFCFYDLDFLSLVYHNSGEDPKVYEHELAHLRKMEPMTQRFFMSIKGNSLEKAVKYLLRCPELEKVYISDFIVRSKMEESAYASIDDSHIHFELVSKLYAKRLTLQQKHIEAGFILKRAKLFAEALVYYKYASEWMEVLSLMRVLKYDDDNRTAIIYEMSENLLKEGRVEEAVVLLDQHNKDYERAIATLVEHKYFRKAICLANMNGAFHIVAKDILPSLKIYMAVLKEKTNNFENSFNNYAERLKIVRQEKIKKFGRTVEGIYGGEEDLYSEAGSSVSSVGSSGSSSRSRR
ncbi:hypothetical protein JTB14_000660 [Gonioctena quinquepunctata]|nr:hypothetical protein JTB14_000660 [Gonioctena quinquepunctata]